MEEDVDPRVLEIIEAEPGDRDELLERLIAQDVPVVFAVGDHVCEISGDGPEVLTVIERPAFKNEVLGDYAQNLGLVWCQYRTSSGAAVGPLPYEPWELVHVTITE